MIRYIFMIIIIHHCMFNIYGQIDHKADFSSIDYKITDVKQEDGKIYKKISTSDLRYSKDSVGYPELPVKYIKLLVPPNSNIEKIVVNKTEKNTVYLNKTIVPVQPPIPTQENYQSPDFVEPKNQAYNLSSKYPKK